MKLESLLQYLDGYLGIADHPDYPNALNGLQVAGPDEIRRVVACVDTSEATIAAAADLGADLMIVHHGLFWGGLEPLTGRHFRKVKALLDAEIALYSCHLPLDTHAEVGNCALLARAMGLDLKGQFGTYQGKEVGWWGTLATATTTEALASELKQVLGGGPVHVIDGGHGPIERVGVVTGGGASFIADAVSAGLDALITGEGSHHSHFDAVELGLTVFFGGHYATETFGVRALSAHLEERFDIPWDFVDQPTGL